MKTALINPPGKRRYLRDYYTATIAKSDYYYPPIDFVWLSASLDRPLKVFDAIAQETSTEDLVRDVALFGPSYIFCLISSLSLKEDIQFIKEVKDKTKAKIITLGDVCRESPDYILSECREIDAILPSFSHAKSWIFRSEEDVPVKFGEEDEDREIRIGVPKWDAFPIKKYRFPFMMRHPVATILTDYGCPFSCDYCPLGRLKWRVRAIDEVIDEIDSVVGMGIHEIHFRDQTFGIDRERTLKLLAHLGSKKIGWSCFSRADVVTEDMLVSMRRSGCHTIIFGIESGKYDFRKRYGKAIKDDLIIRTMKRCAELKINTVGTFIIGLPGENSDDARLTIDFAKTLPLDYASFNIAMPRSGSKLCLEKNGFMPHQEALKLCGMANREFYLRPSYVLNKLLKIKSIPVLMNELRMGRSLVFHSKKFKER